MASLSTAVAAEKAFIAGLQGSPAKSTPSYRQKFAPGAPFSRTVSSRKQFLSGNVAGLKVKPSARMSMSAEPPVDDKSPESAYQKEFAVGKFKREELQERFAVRESGKFECKSCGYNYNPAEGDPSYPIAKGTQFEDTPEDWGCPICGAPKASFVSKAVQLSGFVQNQGYGLGGNAMTKGQKQLLIWGSLAAFFGFFLLGYTLN